MNEILRNIATHIGAAHLIFNKNALTRENCRADLTDLPTDRVVVDMDAVFPSGRQGQKQCDYESHRGFAAIEFPLAFAGTAIGKSLRFSKVVRFMSF